MAVSSVFKHLSGFLGLAAPDSLHPRPCINIFFFFLEIAFLLKCQINVLITAQSSISEPSDTSEVKVQNVRIV